MCLVWYVVWVLLRFSDCFNFNYCLNWFEGFVVGCDCWFFIKGFIVF